VRHRCTAHARNGAKLLDGRYVIKSRTSSFVKVATRYRGRLAAFTSAESQTDQF
jgi:hypothetical protein